MKCKFEGCDRLATTKKFGWCASHDRQIKTGYPQYAISSYDPVDKSATCLVTKCENIPNARKLCNKHLVLANTYKISPVEVAFLLDIEVCQNPYCNFSGHLYIDHDHATGEVRGMLCRRCNFGLGWFDDDPNKVLGAMEYLLKPPGPDYLRSALGT